ncbi:MAG: SDR family NAD(P)-dependent oxidoreductase [Burkholderiales bacterium]|nr:SDR family NAD(P)-dependent oxidoreductase [Phycisphaerae bacterium]
MTGATSGIGAIAAQLLQAAGKFVVVGARGSVAPPGTERRELDLANFASVRRFAASIDMPVDAVVLNAGVQRPNVDARTPDGFEMTFGVNHLAHYLLARLLLPRIVDGGRLIITTSGTHDPAEKTGMPAPRTAFASELADPSSHPDHDRRPFIAGLRAYTSSKLCNLMTARSLAADPEVVSRRIRVHAYDPGGVPGTGLSRDAPFVFRKILLPLLTLLRPIIPGTNTLGQAGTALAGLADGSITGAGVYMALRKGKPTWPKPSLLARDDQACEQLWIDSAKMVGLAN